MNTLETLQSLVGVKFNSAEYLKKVRNQNLPYAKEVQDEVERISNSNPDRSFFDIIKRCEQGKVPEVFLRELQDSPFKNSTKRFHDLIDDQGCHTEVKDWNFSSIDANLEKFLSGPIYGYNTSEFLAIFSHDAIDIYLERVIVIERKEKQVHKEVPRQTKEVLEVHKYGKSFTISGAKCRTFEQRPTTIRFIESGKKAVEKTSDWFIQHRRLSYDNQNYYVFATDL